MYAALCNLPQALGWKNFEFPPNSQRNEKDHWGVRLKVVNSIVQRIAELRDFPIKEIDIGSGTLIHDQRVLVRLNKDPFASPSSSQDRVTVPSSWLLHTNDLTSEANPSSRKEMEKNPNWTKSLFEFLQTATATLDEGPKTLFQKIEAEETWLTGHRLCNQGLDQASLALAFIIQHELGHVYYNHSVSAKRNRKQALFSGAAIFLVIALTGGLVGASSRKLSLTVGIEILALGSGVLTKTLVHSRLTRKQERDADLFAISAVNHSLKEKTIEGGIALFSSVVESGKEARSHHHLRKILFNDKGDNRYFFNLDHPSSTERLHNVREKK